MAYTDPEIRYDNCLPEVLDVVGDSSGTSIKGDISAAFFSQALAIKAIGAFYLHGFSNGSCYRRR